MILIDKNQATLHFNHKDRRRKSLDLQFDLISGAVCPACSNVIIASFVTSKAVNLRPYEQTSIMFTRTLENNGNFSHYFPADDDSDDTSAYDIKVEKFGDKFIQTLRLKNHIMLPEQANRVGKEAMEVGERTCLLSGVAAMDIQLATELSLAITGNSIENISKLKFNDPVKDHFGDVSGYSTLTTHGFRIQPSYGQIPLSVILIPKDKVENRTYYYPAPTSYRSK